jgi:MSHA pilin protein MshA
MKKQAGFTLIELVIVIVILGILGAVAAPKFLNLQGDAYGANLNSLKNTMESAATLANTKAMLAGKDEGNKTITIDGQDTALVWGFPAATSAGILTVLEINASDAEGSDYVYVTGTPFKIYPSARASNATCLVQYTAATSVARPIIAVTDSGC